MAGTSDDEAGCVWLLLIAAAAGAYYYFKKPEPAPPTVTPMAASEELTTENLVANDPIEKPAPPPPPKPSHNYDFREGDNYGYVAAISEEDQKKGVAAKSVVTYQFRGIIDGQYTLDRIDPAGRVISMSTCPKDCHAIRTWSYGQRDILAYNPASIIGAAMEDALKGRMRTKKPIKLVPIPEPVDTPEPVETTNEI